MSILLVIYYLLNSTRVNICYEQNMATGRVEVAPRIIPDLANRELIHDHGASQSIISEPKKKEVLYFNGNEDVRQIDGSHVISRDARNDSSSLASQAKSFLSISNEYWLIGIIIVLITVILMLIVYIMKIKQGAPDATTDRGGPNHTTDANAKSPLHEAPPMPSDSAKIQYLNQRRFVPHSVASSHGPTIEPIDDAPRSSRDDDARHPEPEPEPAPLLTMCHDAAPLEEPHHDHDGTQNPSATERSAPAETVAPVMMPPTATAVATASADCDSSASSHDTPTRRVRKRT